MIELLLIIAIVVYIVKKVNANNNANKKKYTPQQYFDAEFETQPLIETKEQKGKDYTNGYQPKWLLTYNEKAAYKVIKQVCDNKGYTVFTKVRLLDLVEPRGSHKKDQSYLWKIQAKHVDFVVCNENLVAKWIIEIQDNSHKATDREERDALVRDILTACDYKVLMTYGPTKEEISSFISNKTEIAESNPGKSE